MTEVKKHVAMGDPSAAMRVSAVTVAMVKDTPMTEVDAVVMALLHVLAEELAHTQKRLAELEKK